MLELHAGSEFRKEDTSLELGMMGLDTSFVPVEMGTVDLGTCFVLGMGCIQEQAASEVRPLCP